MSNYGVRMYALPSPLNLDNNSSNYALGAKVITSA